MRRRHFMIGAKLITRPRDRVLCGKGTASLLNLLLETTFHSFHHHQLPAIPSSMFLLSQVSPSQIALLARSFSFHIPTLVSTALINHSQIELPTEFGFGLSRESPHSTIVLPPVGSAPNRCVDRSYSISVRSTPYCTSVMESSVRTTTVSLFSTVDSRRRTVWPAPFGNDVTLVQSYRAIQAMFLVSSFT